MRAFLKIFVAIAISVMVCAVPRNSEGGQPASIEIENALSPVEEKKNFEPGDAVLSHQGWAARDDATYFWAPGEDKNPILNMQIPVTDVPLNHEPSRNELQIDYQDLFPNNPAQISLNIVLKEGGGQEKLLKADREKHLTAADTLDTSLSPWAMKGYWYVFKRVFGRPVDSTWYYDQKGSDTFFLKRFHMDLASIESLDLVFRKDIQPLEIDPGQFAGKNKNVVACNLRIGFGNRLKRSQIVPCNDFAPFIVNNPDRQILRMDFGDFVRGKYAAGEKSVILEELVIRLPGQNAEKMIRHLPLEKIVFQEWDKLQKESALANLTLFSKTEVFGEGRKRLILKLQELANRISKYTTIHSITLSVQPADPGVLSGVHWHHAEIVEAREKAAPVTTPKINTRSQADVKPNVFPAFPRWIVSLLLVFVILMLGWR